MENQNPVETPITPPKPPRKWFVLGIALFSIILVAILVYFLPKVSKNISFLGQKNELVSTSKKELPQKNIVLFTRCFGGERQFNYCNLYASNLKEPNEMIAYTFDFPSVQQTDYESAFNLELLGVTNKKVAYIKTYWEKVDQKTQNTKVLGVLDLDTLENAEIFKQTQGGKYLSSHYLDNPNTMLYYTTSSYTTSDEQIIQYNLSSKASKIVTDSSKLGANYILLSVSDSKLFLSPPEEGPGSELTWAKTFDIGSGAFEENIKARIRPIFSPKADMVAWVDEEKAGANFTNLKLKVSKIDGTDEKEIYTLNSKNDYEGGFLSNITDYYFNTYGDRLSFRVSLSDENGQTQNDKQYISFLEVRKTVEPNQKGITIIPIDNPNIYKNLMEVQPGKEDYQWVKFLTLGGPLAGNAEEGVIFEEDGAWYLKSDVDLTWYKDKERLTSLIGNRQAVTVKGKNLFVLPTW